MEVYIDRVAGKVFVKDNGEVKEASISKKMLIDDVITPENQAIVDAQNLVTETYAKYDYQRKELMELEKVRNIKKTDETSVIGDALWNKTCDLFITAKVDYTQAYLALQALLEN